MMMIKKIFCCVSWQPWYRLHHNQQVASGVGEDLLQLGVFGPVHLDPGGPHDLHQPRLQLIRLYHFIQYKPFPLFNISSHYIVCMIISNIVTFDTCHLLCGIIFMWKHWVWSRGAIRAALGIYCDFIQVSSSYSLIRHLQQSNTLYWST